MEEVEEATLLTVHLVLASIYQTKNPDFLLWLLTSITNFKFLACVKHVEGKLCFYRIYHIVHSETRQKLFLSARIKLNYHIFAFLWGSGIAGSPSVYLHLIFAIPHFEMLSWKGGKPPNSYSPFPWIVQIFPAGTPQFPVPLAACRIAVWNRLKTKFIKLDNSNWRIAKIGCR